MDMETKKGQVITQDLRSKLKAIFETEIEKIAELLETLEPKERLNLLCKIMPFVLPKVESIYHDLGEPDKFGFN